MRGFFDKQRHSKWWGTVLIILIFCLLTGWGTAEISRVSFLRNCTYTQLLVWGMGKSNEQQNDFALAGNILFCLAGVDTRYLPGILQRGLPAAFGSSRAAAAQKLFTELGEQPLYLQEEEDEAKPKTYQVAVYHTHNAETYIPYHGKSKVEGENGGVGMVAAEMAGVLEKEGIYVVHDLTIHDYPDFPTSYIKSEATARRLVEENSSLKVLIDLHRDAGLPNKETANVEGQDVARVLLIIGNGERLANPHWRENYALAQLIAHRLEEKYPGVLKGVRLKEGRFNQHVSPGAILIEVGSDKNTLEESLGAGRCVANVLVELIPEENDQ